MFCSCVGVVQSYGQQPGAACLLSDLQKMRISRSDFLFVWNGWGMELWLIWQEYPILRDLGSLPGVCMHICLSAWTEMCP